jgi:hypothetical protein
MKVQDTLNHMISQIWTMFGYHVTNLKIEFQKLNFFQQRYDNCVKFKILTGNHIHMEYDKHN